MNPIDQLIVIFERFPGIGPRQARRFVQFLLSQNSAFRNDFAENLQALGTETASCKKCFRWFVKTSGVGPLCAVCSNPARDKGLLFVIEKEADIDTVERGGFTGLYFVLSGTMPLAEEHPERFIRAKELMKRIETDTDSGVLKEIILGLSATAEGDHTRLLLQEKLLPLAAMHGFKISSLGRGLSTGSELEYADPETIASALSSRI